MQTGVVTSHMPSVVIIQALEKKEIMFVVKLRLIFAFEMRFVHINFCACPKNPRWRHEKGISGKTKNLIYKVKATVLFLLSHIFMMLNSQRLKI